MPDCVLLSDYLAPSELFTLRPVGPFSVAGSDIRKQAAFQWFLALGPNQLLFGGKVSKSAVVKPGTSAADFAEGLWEFDVLELFISNASDTEYQEFNLAPNGAWWASTFLDYRARSNSPPPNGVETFSEMTNSSFSAALSVPLSETCFRAVEFSQMRANLCSIFFSPLPQYFSFHPNNRPKPDFHARESFQPLRPLP